MLVPKMAYLTKGVGKHKEKLASFEMALRDAGIAAQNLVRVSSIFPPNCKMISRKKGEAMLRPGQILFVVLSEQATNEPNRLIAASVGVALPNDRSTHGYLSEHRHPCRERHLELRRYVSRRYGKACSHLLRAGHDDHGQ